MVPDCRLPLDFLFKQIDQRVGGAGGEEEVPPFGGGEAGLVAVLDEGEEVVVEAVDVQHADGLADGSVRDFALGEGVEEFVPGAEGAGKGDDGVGAAQHFGLSLGEAVDAHDLVEAGHQHAVGEVVGEDPGDMGAVFECGARHQRHGALVGASEDEAVAAPRNAGAQKKLSTEELMLLNCGVGEDS